MNRARTFLALCIFSLLSACGGSGGGYSTGVTTTTGNGNNGNPTTAQPNTVTLGDVTFQPGTMTVARGTTITWKWPTCVDNSGGYGGGRRPPHKKIFCPRRQHTSCAGGR